MTETETVARTEPDIAEDEKRVAPLELFFDLVFVFGITQVTALMADNPTWQGLGQGLRVLAVIWFAWGAFSWLTNFVDTDQDRERLLMFAVMGAMLVASLAVPGAFGDQALLFACAYTLVRWLHIFVFAEANDDVDAATAIRRLSRTALPGPALLIAASFVDGGGQWALWILALVIDFGGPYVFGVEGFRVSPGHFSERFGLIVIIALGESIVAIGAGGSHTIDTPTVTAAVLGLVITAAMWWAYFDVAAILAERRFRATRGLDTVLVARDAYSYMHLPMIAGIVLLALGLKKTIEHVDEPLQAEIATALFGGIALYLLAHVAFKWRVVGTVSTPRLITAGLCLVAIPFATDVDALVAIAVAAVLASGLIAFESLRYADARRSVRL